MFEYVVQRAGPRTDTLASKGHVEILYQQQKINMQQNSTQQRRQFTAAYYQNAQI